MIQPLFLVVLAHGAAGAWDEIIPITLAILTAILGVVIFLVARRFKPDEEEASVDEDAPS
jgi:hypothetical protein